jgi:hypothetical protein
MKHVILSLLFIVIGSFAFANKSNNEKLKFESEIVKEKTHKVIDFKTFMSKFDYKNIDKNSIIFDAISPQFTHIDSCGNTWTVTYWGFTFDEVAAILYNLDFLLCILAS